MPITPGFFEIIFLMPVYLNWGYFKRAVQNANAGNFRCGDEPAFFGCLNCVLTSVSKVAIKAIEATRIFTQAVPTVAQNRMPSMDYVKYSLIV